MVHSQEFLDIVAEAKTRVREITIADTQQRQQQGATLIDVREDHEWQEAHAPGAQHIGRGILERDIVQTYPDKNTEIILYCGGGNRSALAADNLQKMGYTNVWSMIGGWKGWLAENAPTASEK